MIQVLEFPIFLNIFGHHKGQSVNCEKNIILGNKNVDTAKDIFEVYKRGR